MEGIESYHPDIKSESRGKFQKVHISSEKDLSELESIDIEIESLYGALDGFDEGKENKKDSKQREIIAKQINKLEMRRNIIELQKKLDNINQKQELDNEDISAIEELEMRIQALEDREYDIDKNIKTLEDKMALLLKDESDTEKIDNDDEVTELQESDILVDDEDAFDRQKTTEFVRPDNLKNEINFPKGDKKVEVERNIGQRIIPDRRESESADQIEPSLLMAEILVDNSVASSEVERNEESTKIVESENELKRQVEEACTIVISRVKKFIKSFREFLIKRSNKKLAPQEEETIRRALALGGNSLIKIESNSGGLLPKSIRGAKERTKGHLSLSSVQRKINTREGEVFERIFGQILDRVIG